MASKGLTERHFCASVQRMSSRRGMPPRVFCKKSPQAIENKRWESEKERKERKRVRKLLKIKGQWRVASDPSRRALWVNEWREEAKKGHTPVATGSMRKVLRMGEILALRGARDGGNGWLREYTRGCGGKEGRAGDTVSNLGLENSASVTICQVRN